MEFLDTCNRYDAAPLEGFQIKVVLVETPAAPFGGAASVGVDGGVVGDPEALREDKA
ncbi:MAG: hypothetical protein AAB393_17810 [Bacteroidota bacterium]